MSISALTGISNFVKSMGQAYVFTGSVTTAGGLTCLGATEGEIHVDEAFKYNDLKAPEWTGDAVISRQLDGQALKIQVPLIMGDPAIYDKVSPVGVRGGGRSKPTPIVTTSLVIVPLLELQNGAVAYNGTTWTPAAPIHWVWVWKAMVMPGKYGFAHANGGKIIRTIEFEPLFDDTKPEGQKLYSIGDPTTQGVTGLLI